MNKFRAAHLCDVDTHQEYWSEIEAIDAEHAAEVFAEFECEHLQEVSQHDVAVCDEAGEITKWRVTIEITTDYYASQIDESEVSE